MFMLAHLLFSLFDDATQYFTSLRVDRLLIFEELLYIKERKFQCLFKYRHILIDNWQDGE